MDIRYIPNCEHTCHLSGIALNIHVTLLLTADYSSMAQLVDQLLWELCSSTMDVQCHDALRSSVLADLHRAVPTVLGRLVPRTTPPCYRLSCLTGVGPWAFAPE